ncbi:MAG: hypothetical protein M1286_03840 [Candidatus Marsarchaeota archaeon]|nr:hypothetical protein [Candidatus Marsarchaeota archaeon]
MRYNLIDEPSDSWNETLGRAYPELNKIINSDGDKAEPINEFVDRFYEKHGKEFETAAGVYQKVWDPINDGVMQGLSEIIEREWDVDEVRGYLTLNPICPRFLETSSFQVTYSYAPETTKLVSLHEITHFLYFKKWKEVFPNEDEKKFNSPHLIWALSEILVAPIDNDKRVRGYLSEDARSYSSYYWVKVKDGGRDTNVVEYFEKLYNTMITEKKRPFAELLEEARKTVLGMRRNFEKTGIMLK